ncbi:rRNA maturation RNase YbeY [Buchnera aphidicola]|uniref:rRNA maturation RNase YbeY n=1 Tax=Buchnera aphidicola TaxID=9 RepID=UPI00094D8B05|nr:rRNA maturation RNase YbeY [Buchnera aphidicola]
MHINIQYCIKKKNGMPEKKDFIKWLYFIFYKKNVELTIRIVTTKEIKELNNTYRNKNIATNVLSFPMNNISLKKNYRKIYLGDIVICSQYLKKEAHQFKKNLEEHWAHIVIHAGLHLINYTHNTIKKQKKMENLEKNIMKKLGYKNPYQEN